MSFISKSNKYYDEYSHNSVTSVNNKSIISSGTVLFKNDQIGIIRKTISNESDYYKELKNLNLIERFGFVFHDDFQEKFTPQGSSSEILKHKNEEIYFCDNVIYVKEGITLPKKYSDNVIVLSNNSDIHEVIKKQIRKDLQN